MNELPSPLPSIGIVGIGQIGLALARNLITAGYAVAGYRRSAADAFLAMGGRLCGSPAEVVRRSQIVFLCLPSVNAAKDVLDGAAGILAEACADQIYVECSSHPLEDKRAIATLLGAKGASLVECEISGTPRNLEESTALLMLAGDDRTLNALRPCFDAISPRSIRLGAFGASLAMKTVINYLLAIHNLATAEAMLMESGQGSRRDKSLKLSTQAPCNRGCSSARHR